MCPIIPKSFGKKILLVDPDCSSFGLGLKLPICPKGEFLEILLMGFLFTYYVYLAEEFLKNSTEQTLRHKLPQFGDRFGPKMATLHQNGNVFWNFSSCNFFLPTLPYYGAKFKKIPWSGYWDISWHDVISGQNWAKIVPFPKGRFFWRLGFCDFCLSTMTYYAAKFQKFLRAHLEMLACLSLGQDWVQIASFLQKQFFSEHFTYANIVYLLIPIMLQSFKKIVKPDPEIFVCVRFGQNLTKITHLPHKRIFWRFHLCDFNLHKNIQKKVLDIFRQAHRYTNNNKFFDLIITGQICSKKSVAIKIANFFFVSFLLSFSFVLLLTFLIFCLFFILHSLNKNKCRDNG